MSNIVQVNYRREPGYGDIVSPICYAHNICAYLAVPTQLSFFYTSDDCWYENPKGEPVGKRVEYIFENTNKRYVSTRSNLSLSQVYQDDPLHYKHNMIEGLKFHNWRVCREEIQWRDPEDYVVFVTPRNNHVPFEEYPKPEMKLWKNPLSDGQWEELESKFKNRKYVDYETPIEEAVEILRHAKLVFSYHGSAGWLARWVGCPMVIFSNRPRLSKYSFPNAIIRGNNYEKFFDSDYVDHCATVAQERTEELNHKLQRYLKASV